MKRPDHYHLNWWRITTFAIGIGIGLLVAVVGMK